MQWIFVMTQYHSLHHTRVGAYNLGSYFTIFDRLFGTYLDPESINPDEQTFGITNQPLTWQKVIGI